MNRYLMFLLLVPEVYNNLYRYAVFNKEKLSSVWCCYQENLLHRTKSYHQYTSKINMFIKIVIYFSCCIN